MVAPVFHKTVPLQSEAVSEADEPLQIEFWLENTKGVVGVAPLCEIVIIFDDELIPQEFWQITEYVPAVDTTREVPVLPVFHRRVPSTHALEIRVTVGFRHSSPFNAEITGGFVLMAVSTISSELIL